MTSQLEARCSAVANVDFKSFCSAPNAHLLGGVNSRLVLPVELQSCRRKGRAYLNFAILSFVSSRLHVCLHNLASHSWQRHTTGSITSLRTATLSRPSAAHRSALSFIRSFSSRSFRGLYLRSRPPQRPPCRLVGIAPPETVRASGAVRRDEPVVWASRLIALATEPSRRICTVHCLFQRATPRYVPKHAANPCPCQDPRPSAKQRVSTIAASPT